MVCECVGFVKRILYKLISSGVNISHFISDHREEIRSSNMKVFVILALAVVVRGTVVPAIAVAETGASAQFRSEDNLGNYNFGYNEDHTSGGTFRREVGDAHGNVAGSYGLRDADGRIRIVNYIANDDGFKADIKTNEPGVEPKDPADATINKAESVIVESAIAPAPYVAIPQEEPVAYAAPIFPPVAAAPVAKTIAAPITYTFPEPAAVPVAKTHTTVTTAEANPVVYAFPAPAAVPVAKSHATTTITETKPVSYAFPAPLAVPVGKSHTTTTVTGPASSTTITETKPVGYAFPAPAAVPVAKTHTTYAETKPVAYAFPAPAVAPVAKSHTTTITESKPYAYAFPAPAAVPVAKSHTTTVTETKPVAYAFPAPAAVPVATSHTTTVTETKPVDYAFPEPAAVPVAKTIVNAPVAVAEAAPLTYAFPAPAAVPVAKSSSISYSPISYGPAAINYGPALRYTINPHLSALTYASPFYKSIYSPWVASVAGSVPYFNNIEYHGYPVVKK